MSLNAAEVAFTRVLNSLQSGPSVRGSEIAALGSYWSTNSEQRTPHPIAISEEHKPGSIRTCIIDLCSIRVL